MQRFISPYYLWVILALPAAMMTNQLVTSPDPRIAHILLHPSGEFAARFLIIAMLATPLTMLFKGWRGPIWLKKNRRYFGVAAFAYAALHTVLYVVDLATLDRIIADLPKLWIWTGWVAFAIFIPLAVTSSDYFVRRMGPNWKSLQRWTYPAAILTFLHWVALHNWEEPAAAIVHFTPLAALTIFRLWDNFNRRRKRRISTPA
ncbi:sulfite oxidase heme-binding subunit YedZ [Shimia sp. Alg240-R146]|uniref:sulfite oxidase heme-binding subunit YedZ n=1 Tax=Shimia sp. Alg240-R146 TaxID=2993449 RepID=UPI0022E014FB|nr:ferric reductase-like transmembrane domain-containing protein [Shimia sp. Alg240-R146]